MSPEVRVPQFGGERNNTKPNQDYRRRDYRSSEQELAARAIMSPSDDESWQSKALCAQADPEAFFPERGGSTKEAKRVCQGCDVRAECLEYALRNDERFGVWGGLTERQRRKLKRRQDVSLSR